MLVQIESIKFTCGSERDAEARLWRWTHFPVPSSRLELQQGEPRIPDCPLLHTSMRLDQPDDLGTSSQMMALLLTEVLRSN